MAESTIKTGIKKVGECLFHDGISFFFLYLFLYGVGLALNLQSQTLRPLFWTLHVLLLSLFIPFLIERMRTLPRQNLHFWAFLVAITFWAGAYLEFPADPWDHLRNILTWENKTYLRDSRIWDRFGFYWAWTWIGWKIPTVIRSCAHLYATALQLILCYQVYRLARVIDKREDIAQLSVLGYLFLFGTNVFGFRYYALAPTAISYSAYLCALGILFRFEKLRPKDLPKLMGLVLLTFFNHKQEFLLFAVALTAILCFHSYLRFPYLRKPVAVILGISIVFSFGVGWYLRNYFPSFFQNVIPPFLTSFGSFRIWRRPSAFLETLALHGVVSYVFALIYFRKFPLVSWLTIFPAMLLAIPLTALPIAHFSPDGYITYRFLYLLPASFLFVLGWHAFFEKFAESKTWLSPSIAVFFVILAFGVPPWYPFRGRLIFQFYQPNVDRALVPLDETAEWFLTNRAYLQNCPVGADRTTSFVLSTFTRLNVEITRGMNTGFTEALRIENLKYWIHLIKPCGILVPQVSQLPKDRRSWMGDLSKHWESGAATVNKDSEGINFQLVEKILRNKGWKSTFVPPYYSLWENP
jgi:hypothetical protein